KHRHSALVRNGTLDAELPKKLVEYSQITRPPIVTPLRGHPRRIADDVLIQMLARAYHSCGGRVAISPTGPFSRALALIWEFLPADLRPRTPEALQARAKTLLPTLRKDLEDVSKLRGYRALAPGPHRWDDVQTVVSFKRDLDAPRSPMFAVIIDFDLDVCL